MALTLTPSHFELKLLQNILKIYFKFSFRSGNGSSLKPRKLNLEVDSPLAVDVTCFFGSSKNSGIGHYSRWFLGELVRAEVEMCLFRDDLDQTIELQLINDSEEISFKVINVYEDLDSLLQTKDIKRLLSLSPFEECINTLIYDDVSSLVILYDLIPLLRPWQFKKYKSRKIYLKKVKQLKDVQVLAISEHTRNQLLYFFKNLNASVIPFDPKNYLRPTVKNQTPGKMKFLVFSGNDPRKNLPLVIKSWLEANTSSSNELLVIGEVTISENFKKKLGNASVFFKNKVSDFDRNQLLSDCDVVICPSLDEGLGLPLIEAGQYLKPAIFSDIPTHNAWALEGGIKFNPRSKSELSRIFEFLSAGHEIDPIVVRGQQLGIQEFLSEIKVC